MATKFFDLFPKFIFGGDGEGEGAGSDSSDSGKSTSSDASTSTDESAGSSSEAEGEDESTDGDSDTAALRKALEAERRARKAAEKKAAIAAKKDEEAELAKRGEVEQLTVKLTKSAEQLTKLKTGYLNTKLEAAIRNAAAEFQDPTDAVSGVDRSLIDYEQDDDDPSDVTIDEKSVKAAVKKLATSKPHWLKQGTSDGDKTGSQFGAGSGGKKKTPDEAYLDKYPALR